MVSRPKLHDWNKISFRDIMVRDAVSVPKTNGGARQFLLWSTCSQIIFCSEMHDALRFSVRKPKVRARRKPCINDTNRSNICHLEHVLCIKHVPRFVLVNDFGLAEYRPWLQNMHSETCLRAESIVKYNTAWALGIPAFPDMTSKTSCT